MLTYTHTSDTITKCYVSVWVDEPLIIIEWAAFIFFDWEKLNRVFYNLDLVSAASIAFNDATPLIKSFFTIQNMILNYKKKPVGTCGMS